MVDFPLERFIKNVTFEHITNTLISRGAAGYREAANYGGGFWSIQVSTRPLSRAYADVFSGFLDGLRGGLDIFNLTIPFYSKPKLAYSGVVLVDGASQTGRDIEVDGMPTNTTVLRQGEFVKFENQNKIYRLREDLVSDITGAGTLKLHMDIVSTIPGNDDNVVFNNVPFRVSISDAGNRATEIDVNGYTSFTFELEEVWN